MRKTDDVVPSLCYRRSATLGASRPQNTPKASRSGRSVKIPHRCVDMRLSLSARWSLVPIRYAEAPPAFGDRRGSERREKARSSPERGLRAWARPFSTGARRARAKHNPPKHTSRPLPTRLPPIHAHAGSPYRDAWTTAQFWRGRVEGGVISYGHGNLCDLVRFSV